MNTTKLTLSSLMCLATVTTFAQYASTEVALVADLGGTTPLGATAQTGIERYDPVSGQYLGSFGQGRFVEPVGMAVSGQIVYVADDRGSFSTISEYNWSTGAYVGQIYSSSPYQIFGLAVFGSSLLASDYGDASGNFCSLETFDLATGALLQTTALPAGSHPYKISTLGNQAFVSAAGSAGGIYRFNLNANGTVNGAAFHFGSNPEAGVATFTDKSATSYVFSSTGNGSSKSLEEYLASTGTFSQSLTLPAGSNTYNALGFGHSGILYAEDSPNGRIDRYDANFPLSLANQGSFRLNYTGSAANMVVYSAPEPLTLAGFGLGLLAVLKKKRKG